MAACSMRWSIDGAIDATMAVDEMMRQVRAVRDGDMSGVKEMLLSQAIATQAIFTEYSRRALATIDNPEITDCYMRLALKGQAQSRANLEAIAEINMPRTVFAKQANITSGPQQVNNGTPPAARAEIEKPIPENKLLGGSFVQ